MGIYFNNVIALIIVAIIQHNYVIYYDFIRKLFSHNHKFPVQIKILKDYIFDIYEKLFYF